MLLGYEGVETLRLRIQKGLPATFAFAHGTKMHSHADDNAKEDRRQHSAVRRPCTPPPATCHCPGLADHENDEAAQDDK